MNEAPIGIFDSGLGGLSVWKEAVRLLPGESIVYYADSGNCPYGPRPEEEIIHLSEEIVKFLLKKNCKLIVIACNTATAAAVSYLREKYEVPFVGIEPALKPASLATTSGHIGVLATKGTFKGKHYLETRKRHAWYVDVHIQVGDGLVEIVENGHFDSQEAYLLLENYLKPMLDKKVDQLVLGCTHYPFLIPQIKEIVGDRMKIIDPAPAVARQIQALLEEKELFASENQAGIYEFYTTGILAMLQRMVKMITDTREFNRSNFWKIGEE
ncbi:MAG: glutamate racemase [Bacteroidia bacterium]